MTSRRGALVAVVLSALLLLSGCGIGAPRSAPRVSPSASPHRTAPPSASPTPTAAPAAVLSTAGLGRIRMGSAIPADNGLAVWDPTACAEGPAGSVPGLWTPTGPRTGTSPLGRATAFGVLTEDGGRDTAVSLLQVWASDYRTPSGLHVGSTDAEVRAALPAVAPQTMEGVRWYSVVDSGWRITLTVPDRTEDPSDGPGVVELISVYPASERDWPWWGTDVGAHCGT